MQAVVEAVHTSLVAAVLEQVEQVVVAQVEACRVLPTQAAVVAALNNSTMAVKAAQGSSSFPILAHRSLVAVSSLLLAATPFTHLQLLALLFQLHL